MAHTKPVELIPYDHQREIEEAAYYKWLNRGRVGGDPLEDWIEAELEFQTNLYSDDDEVERSLMSSVPNRIKPARLLTSTSDQTAMATQQNNT